MRLFILLAATLAGCATIPPERVERDRAFMTAIQPCRLKYPDVFHMDRVYVKQDGTLRYWYEGRATGRIPEVEQCVAEARKGLKLGPWALARVTSAGPTTVATSASGKEIVVPMRVNGVEGTMVLRRNSQLTSVSADYAKRSGLYIGRETPTERVRIGGQTRDLPFVRAASLRVGEVLIEGIDIAVYDELPGRPAADGVLGNNVLSQFQMRLDRRNNRLTLEPRAGASSARGALVVLVE